MRTASAGLIAFLNSHTAGTWRHLVTITPRASVGSPVYWTDHDADLVLGGHTFVAGGTGTVPILEFGERYEAAGTEIGSLDLTLLCGSVATFQGVRLPIAAANRAFDGAVVKVDRVFGEAAVDLTLGSMHVFEGIVAEARPSSTRVELEIESGLAALNVEIPRKAFRPGCTNILFDTQCGLVEATYTVTGTVGATGNSTVAFTSDRTEATNYFDLGVIKFAANTTTAALRGVWRAVRLYSSTAGTFTPDRPLPAAPVSGDTFTVYPGCPKTFAACETKFLSDNRARFRGFPHVPYDPGSEVAAERRIYGNPVPVVYGANRLGGATIDAWPGPIGAWGIIRGICEGPVEGIDTVYQGENAWPAGLAGGWVAGLGTRPTQTLTNDLTGLPLLSGGIGYPGVALIAHVVGSSTYAMSGAFQYEVRGLLSGTGGTEGDADPAQIVQDLFPDDSYGADFPFTIITNVGLDDSSGSYSAGSSFSTYCAQEEFWLSPLLTERKAALDVLQELCDATNAEALWKEGQLWIVPRADQAVGSFTPCTSIRYNFVESELISKGGDRVTLTLDPETETYNVCPVTFRERAPQGVAADPTLAYNEATEQDPDPVDVAIRGERPAPDVSFPAITRRPHALKLARILAQRQVRARQEIEMSTGWRFCRLEPLDLCTVSDSRFPFTAQPFQIRKIKEDMKTGVLTITAQEWTAGVNVAYAHATQSSDGTGIVSPGFDEDWTTYLLQGQAGELWPNGTSELTPPSNVVPDSPAAAYRYEAGAGAYAGTWVRRLVNTEATAGASVLLESPDVYAVPGHTYTFDAQMKTVSGTGDAFIQIVASADSWSITNESVVVTAGTWTKRSVSMVVPSAATRLRAAIVARKTGAGGSFTADFDAITFYRSSVTPPTLTASLTPSTVSGTCERVGSGSCSATTTSVTASGSGGVPLYTYAWEYVSGTTATINSPTSATTTFTRTASASPGGQSYSGVYRCVVTDHDGTTAATGNVTVATTHYVAV